MKTINELCDIVRETSYAIHLYHAHGPLEKVYENALTHRLRKAGLDVKQQHSIKVLDEDSTVIGEFNADLLVEGQLVVELKAARTLADEHVAQLLGYLKSTQLQHGLLINFGSYKFEVKKYALSQSGTTAPAAVWPHCCLRSLRPLRSLAAKSHGAHTPSPPLADCESAQFSERCVALCSAFPLRDSCSFSGLQ